MVRRHPANETDGRELFIQGRIPETPGHGLTSRTHNDRRRTQHAKRGKIQLFRTGKMGKNGALALDGTAALSPLKADGKLKVNHLALRPFDSYLADFPTCCLPAAQPAQMFHTPSRTRTNRAFPSPATHRSTRYSSRTAMAMGNWRPSRHFRSQASNSPMNRTD